MATADGVEKSRFRYIAVWAKTERGWQLASFRDFADDPAPTANDFLQPIAWLIGSVDLGFSSETASFNNLNADPVISPDGVPF
jgi:hypothetical protein